MLTPALDEVWKTGNPADVTSTRQFLLMAHVRSFSRSHVSGKTREGPHSGSPLSHARPSHAASGREPAARRHGLPACLGGLLAGLGHAMHASIAPKSRISTTGVFDSPRWVGRGPLVHRRSAPYRRITFGLLLPCRLAAPPEPSLHLPPGLPGVPSSPALRARAAWSLSR